MTVQRTREILGDKVSQLTDDELLVLIGKTSKSIDVLMQIATKDISMNKTLLKDEK